MWLCSFMYGMLIYYAHNQFYMHIFPTCTHVYSTQKWCNVNWTTSFSIDDVQSISQVLRWLLDSLNSRFRTYACKQERRNAMCACGSGVEAIRKRSSSKYNLTTWRPRTCDTSTETSSSDQLYCTDKIAGSIWLASTMAPWLETHKYRWWMSS